MQKQCHKDFVLCDKVGGVRMLKALTTSSQVPSPNIYMCLRSNVMPIKSAYLCMRSHNGTFYLYRKRKHSMQVALMRGSDKYHPLERQAYRLPHTALKLYTRFCQHGPKRRKTSTACASRPHASDSCPRCRGPRTYATPERMKSPP